MMKHARTTLDGTPNRSDQGVILVLTLILTTVLAVIVLALATYAVTGLRTSDVTTARTQNGTVTGAALDWYLEQLSNLSIEPSDQHPSLCPDAGTPPLQVVPVGVLAPYGQTATIECTSVRNIGFHPTFRLVANAVTVDGKQRTTEVIVQLPYDQRVAQIHSWIDR